MTFAVDGTIYLTNTIILSNTVILDGTNHSITISGSNTVNIFYLLPSANVSLRHLNLANGVTNGFIHVFDYNDPAVGTGGAIYSQGILDVEECTFSNNVAAGGSGAFSGYLSSTQELAGYGGAIYSTGQLTITNTIFANNTAEGGTPAATDYVYGGDGAGGAIYNNGGNVVLNTVSFLGNTASGGAAGYGSGTDLCGGAYGGAFFSTGGSLIASNIVASGNNASGGYFSETYTYGPGSTGGTAVGGALYITGSTASISLSVFANNIVRGGGSSTGGAPGGLAEAGAIFNSGQLTMSNLTVYGSHINAGSCGNDGQPAPALGGAVFNAGQMQITGLSATNNACYAGNQNGDEQGYPSGAPSYGGAIYNTGQMGITNGTITQSTSQAGGGDYGFFGTPSPGADGRGGCIYNTGGLTLQTVTISDGAAVAGTGSTAQDEIAGNGWGGAIFNSGFVHFYNTILSSNTAAGTTIYGEQIYSTGIIATDADSILVPVITGTPPLQYQWQNGGTNLAGDTSSTLNLTHVRFASAGTYDLVISNNSGLVANFVEIINQALAPLSISNISPNIGADGTYTGVTISGSGFTSGLMVYFGDMPAPAVTSVTSNSIFAYTPSTGFVGMVNVTVTNGDFQSVVVNNGFSFYATTMSPVSASAIPGQGAQIQFSGIPGRSYVLLTATNLSPPVNWQPVVTNAAGTNGTWSYTDPRALSGPAHYYRAHLP